MNLFVLFKDKLCSHLFVDGWGNIFVGTEPFYQNSLWELEIGYLSLKIHI